MNEKIRILIVDDHKAFLDGLRAMLQSAADVEIIGEATTGAAAVALALTLQPDIIFMDIQMPGMNGVDATRRIVYSSPHIGVIMMTMFEDDDSVFSAMRAGARGYLLKGALKTEVLHVVHGVAAGEAIFGSGLARRVMKFFAERQPISPVDALPELTEREVEVLQLLTHHLTNQEIAEQLSISPKTARNHVSNILSKLQVADRTAAIVRAREAGLK
ncbi:MAG: response regulator transcription factor [Caldilineaceae bacterium]|nr:response regulator transcription factor [Caldilineaceae bacterium]MCB0124488.1 response regulator transcription factor [Caldilineaceae bacterium]